MDRKGLKEKKPKFVNPDDSGRGIQLTPKNDMKASVAKQNKDALASMKKGKK